MKIGYARNLEIEGVQTLDLQLRSLVSNFIDYPYIYVEKETSVPFKYNQSDDRPKLDCCLKALKKGDTLVVWDIDCIGYQYFSAVCEFLKEINASLFVTNWPPIPKTELVKKSQ